MSFMEQMKAFFSKIFDFLWPFIKQFITEEGKIITQVAAKAVADVASNPAYANMSWNEKLAAAVSAAEADLVAQSINAGKTAIINAIQAVITANKEAAAPVETEVKTAFVAAAADADPDVPYTITS